MTISSRTLIIEALDEAYGNAETWYGPNLRPTLTSLTPEQLVDRRTFEGYTAWELAVHCAYWKWFVACRLTGGTDSFPYGQDDFPPLPSDTSERAWMDFLSWMDGRHERLKAATATLDEARLSSPWVNAEGEEQEGSVARMIMGVAFHDAYHTAQIRNMGLAGLAEKKGD